MHDEFYGQKERKTHHEDEPHCCLLFAKSSKTNWATSPPSLVVEEVEPPG